MKGILTLLLLFVVSPRLSPAGLCMLINESRDSAAEAVGDAVLVARVQE